MGFNSAFKELSTSVTLFKDSEADADVGACAECRTHM
jgi:hypothetical protein